MLALLGRILCRFLDEVGRSASRLTYSLCVVATTQIVRL